jgi:hypothetical protein
MSFWFLTEPERRERLLLTIGLDRLPERVSCRASASLRSPQFAAFTIAHLPVLDQFWNSGPALQLVSSDPRTNLTAQNELLKPLVESGAAYGIGELHGIKDPQALGIGSAAGSFAAPWIAAGVDSLYGGHTPEGVPLYISGRPTQYGSIVLNVGSQVDGLTGGLASYGYDSNFSVGQFGAIQVSNFNDKLIIEQKAKDGWYDVDVFEKGKGNRVASKYVICIGDVILMPIGGNIFVVLLEKLAQSDRREK